MKTTFTCIKTENIITISTDIFPGDSVFIPGRNEFMKVESLVVGKDNEVAFGIYIRESGEVCYFERDELKKVSVES